MLQAELKILVGKHQGKSIPLNSKKFLVGREQDCHLRPNSDLVSRHHCVFTTDNYCVHLRDLGSTNGTVVNGKVIRGEVELQTGDLVSIGKLELQLIVKPNLIPTPGEVRVSPLAPTDMRASTVDISTYQATEPETFARPSLAPDSAIAQETSYEIPVFSSNLGDSALFGMDTSIASSAAQAPQLAGSHALAEPAVQSLGPAPGQPYAPQYPMGGYVQPAGYVPPVQGPPTYGYAPPQQQYPPQYFPQPQQGYGPQPGFGPQPMYAGQPGYGYAPAPQPAPQPIPQAATPAPAPAAPTSSKAAALAAAAAMPVRLPDPSETGAKPVVPPPTTAGGAPAAAQAKPSNQAADIIKKYMQQRGGQ